MNLLIVNFHYYREEQYISGIYPTTPDRFEHQIALLSKQYEFISQQTLVSWIQNEIQPTGNYCLITFDDGLKEQMKAYQWLLSKNIPAVFFIPTGPIREKYVLSVHKLQLLRTQITDEDLLKRLEASFDTPFDKSTEDFDRQRE